MSTSIFTVVLTSALLAGQNGSPGWQTSYSAAQRMSAEQQKPVLVVVGSGANGWNKVVREAPSKELTQLMAQKYICVYVDIATPAGKQLAQSFEINGAGLVISDRTGNFQAFWHQGGMTNDSMVNALNRYSDPQFSVRTTETNSSRSRLR